MAKSEYTDRSLSIPSDAADSPAPVTKPMLLEGGVHLVNNLRDHLPIFSNHKRAVVVSFLVLTVLGCALAVVYQKWLYTPRFQAKSSILVKSGWENYYPDPSLTKRQGPAVNPNEMLGAEMSILGSRELREKVISALTPETIFPALGKEKFTGMSKQDRALLLLGKYLKISSAYGSIIDVTFEGTNPQSVASVVNLFVTDYIDKRSEIYKDPKVTLYLQNKVDFYRQKLAQSLNDLKTFSDRTKLFAFDKQRDMLLERRSNLNVALSQMSNEINGLGQTTAELEKQLKSIPKDLLTVGGSDRAGDVQSRLFDLKLKEMELKEKYNDNSPALESLRAQIAATKDYFKKNASNPNISPANPVYQDIQKQIIENKAKMSQLTVMNTGTQTQLDQVNDELKSFEANENQFRTLEATVTSNRQVYTDYRQKLEEANVYNELGRDKMTSVSVIEPAAAPIAPVNLALSLPSLFAAAVVFALFASLGIAYILETYKQVMSTGMEVEKAPELAVFPDMDMEMQKTLDHVIIRY